MKSDINNIKRERVIYYITQKAFLGALTPFTEDYMVLKYRGKKNEICFMDSE